ncbi:MAG: hypothetical protein ACLTMP_11190 [Eggerthella lenta]
MLVTSRRAFRMRGRHRRALGFESAYMPIAKDKGVPAVHLVPGQTPTAWIMCSAFDQCIRVNEKIG